MSNKKIYTAEGGLLYQEIAKIDFISETAEQNYKYSHFADYSFIQNTLKHILGKTLTIIDASTTGSQNKAMKDLVKSIFIDTYTDLTEKLYDEKWLNTQTQGIAEMVSEDEALDIKG